MAGLTKTSSEVEAGVVGLGQHCREGLPKSRDSPAHHLDTQAREGDFPAGMQPDAKLPGERSITTAEEG